jgi:serine/threonine protein kinase
LIDIRHLCIAVPIGFILPSESTVLQESTIIELYWDGCFSSDVISVSRGWWEAKAKAVVGLVLGLRFMHSLGLIHRHLNLNKIHFDEIHDIQIAEFGPIRLEVPESKMGDFSGSGWTTQTNVRGFASIRFEIVFGRSSKSETSIPPNIPEFASTIITTGLWFKSKIQHSFCNIFDISKQNNFQIMEGVDSAEVLAFVNLIESAEH